LGPASGAAPEAGTADTADTADNTVTHAGGAAVWAGTSLPVRPRRRTWPRSRLLLGGGAVVLVLGYFLTAAMQSGAVYYLTVAELQARGSAAQGERVRVAAKVLDGSIQREAGLLRFAVADDPTLAGAQQLRVAYRGVVPDVFGPDVDVVVEGKLTQGGVFEATTLLAKCPSRYEGAADGATGAGSGGQSGAASAQAGAQRAGGR
jgi:cytochrome c-type biogenesis protein CcmE